MKIKSWWNLKKFEKNSKNRIILNLLAFYVAFFNTRLNKTRFCEDSLFSARTPLISGGDLPGCVDLIKNDELQKLKHNSLFNYHLSVKHLSQNLANHHSKLPQSIPQSISRSIVVQM